MTDHETYHQLRTLGLTPDQVRTLQRCATTLHRWAERECNGEIDRDALTHLPCRVIQNSVGRVKYVPTPDRERGALEHVEVICQDHGALHYYHQTDPRGAALYLSPEPLDHQTYTRGIAL